MKKRNSVSEGDWDPNAHYGKGRGMGDFEKSRGS